MQTILAKIRYWLTHDKHGNTDADYEADCDLYAFPDKYRSMERIANEMQAEAWAKDFMRKARCSSCPRK